MFHIIASLSFILQLTESGIEIALRHLSHVKFVEEFTLISFFAQSTKPMLADNCPICPKMSIWAETCSLALSFSEEGAHHCCGF